MILANSMLEERTCEPSVHQHPQEATWDFVEWLFWLKYGVYINIFSETGFMSLYDTWMMCLINLSACPPNRHLLYWHYFVMFLSVQLQNSHADYKATP